MAEQSPLVMRTVGEVTAVTICDTAMLDAIGLHRMGQALHALIDKEGLSKLILDFSDVKFLASTALGVFLTLRRKVADANGRVVACGVRPELFKVFKITSLDQLFEFFDDQAAAFAAFGD